MNLSRPLILIASIMLASGCTHTHKIQANGDANQNATRMNPRGGALVVVPRDGQYGAKVYAGSGHMTAQAIVSAFGGRMQKMEMLANISSIEQATANAKEKSLEYVIYPSILLWEDRVTEWSGIKDKVDLKMTIIEVKTGKEIDSSLIQGRSRWMTFGGDHPQDLLPGPLSEYAARFF